MHAKFSRQNIHVPNRLCVVPVTHINLFRFNFSNLVIVRKFQIQESRFDETYQVAASEGLIVIFSFGPRKYITYKPEKYITLTYSLALSSSKQHMCAQTIFRTQVCSPFGFYHNFHQSWAHSYFRIFLIFPCFCQF